MGSDHIEVGLRDDSHPQLVVGTRQEAGKRGDEGHSPIPIQKNFIMKTGSKKGTGSGTIVVEEFWYTFMLKGFSRRF